MTQAPTASDHINRYIDHRGLGLRSKAGVPLDGEQAFSEGCAFEHNPWRAPGLYNHLRDQWSQEWQFAQRHSARARTETQAPATPELVERLKNLATGFGVAPVYQQAADALEAQQARIAELEAALAERERLILDAHDALEEASDNLRGSYRQPACEAYDRARRAIYAIRSRQALSSQGRHEGGER